MITIYSEKKEIRNNAMPSQSERATSVISGTLAGMRELVKENLNTVKNIDWEKEMQR